MSFRMWGDYMKDGFWVYKHIIRPVYSSVRHGIPCEYQTYCRKLWQGNMCRYTKGLRVSGSFSVKRSHGTYPFLSRRRGKTYRFLSRISWKDIAFCQEITGKHIVSCLKIAGRQTFSGVTSQCLCCWHTYLRYQHKYLINEHHRHGNGTGAQLKAGSRFTTTY